MSSSKMPQSSTAGPTVEAPESAGSAPPAGSQPRMSTPPKSNRPYLPLKPKEIRILHLQPGIFEDPLEATFRVVSLDDPPLYSALSYCWGPPDPEAFMKCDNSSFRITPNLQDALRRFRSATDVLVIWVDAVCINQTNNSEKSEQVAHMREIYSKAQHLFIWFGHPKEPGAADLAFHAFAKMELTLRRTVKEFSELFHLQVDLYSQREAVQQRYQDKIGPDLEGGIIGADEWEAVAEFYSMPWFSRVWIVQEAICVPLHAEPHMTLAYGHCDMSWTRLTIVTGGLVMFGGSSNITNNTPLPTYLITLIERERCLATFAFPGQSLQDMTTGGRGSRMYNLLNLSRRLNSSDHRDKWFAFHGLLTGDIGNEASLAPDYSKSAVDVFVDVTLYFLGREHCLDIFEQTGDDLEGEARLAGLPTWACDWSKTSTVENFPAHLSKFMTGGRNLQGTSPIMSSRLRISDDKRKLVIPMYLVDVIGHQSPPIAEYREGWLVDVAPQGEAPSDLLISQWHYANIVATAMIGQSAIAGQESPAELVFQRLLQNRRGFEQSEKYLTGDSMYEAFWRTLVCNLNSDRNTPESSLAEAFEVYNELMIPDPRRAGLYPEEGLEKETTERYEMFLREHTRYTTQRRFVVGSRGFIGWTLRKANVGDFICIIPGARMPYIFRRAEGGLEMVGHAYIHGLMDELVDCTTGDLLPAGMAVVPSSLGGSGSESLFSVLVS